MVARVCGTPEDKFLKVCEMLASTAAKDRAGTILYALGWTQHSIGAQIIRTGAMVQMLLGNIGIPGGGMNALRGHYNSQGWTDMGLMSKIGRESGREGGCKSVEVSEVAEPLTKNKTKKQ